MHVSWQDLRAAALPVLRHRIVLTYEAQALGVTSDRLAESILQSIEAKR